jgi:hypothetical protein
MKSKTGCLVLPALLALVLAIGLGDWGSPHTRDMRGQVREWFESLTKKKLPPSKTEVLNRQWQAARTRLADALQEVTTASSAEAGMVKFKQATNAGAPDLKEAHRIAAEAVSTAGELRKQKEYYGNAANEALLPAEVRPQLDEALAEHIAALERLNAEVTTLSRQLESMGEMLARQAATCQIQAKLSGADAAKAQWAKKSAEIIGSWKKG